MVEFSMEMSEAEFRAIRDFVEERSGIHLTERKRMLVTNRLRSHLWELGLTSFAEYMQRLKDDLSGDMLGHFLNRITTNHTYFYREPAHFELFRDRVLPDWIPKIPDRDLRIWCAACSSGEEAWTLLFLIHEALGNAYFSWKAGILATDLSTKVLKVAMQGNYPEESCNSLPAQLRQKYFIRGSPGEVTVRQEYRRDAIFRRLNLMAEFPFRKPFHTIFCRNVMIYFDASTRKNLIRKFQHFLMPGGYLFIGHSESLGKVDGFRHIAPSVYQKEEF